MPLVPNNTDPTKDYVSNGIASPPLTSDGLVFNQTYAYTGVIDTLNNVNTTGYSDPILNVGNSSNGLITFDPQASTNWISNPDFGGPASTPVVVTYNLSNQTFYNNISLSVLNVPCYVELLDNNGNALPGKSTFVITGGGDIYTTTDWLAINYDAPSTNYGSFTYPLTGVNNVQVRITRNQVVQSTGQNAIPTDIAYSVGIKNFRMKLNVQQVTDVPSLVINGTKTITTQNRFGFVENYNYSVNSVSNMFTTGSGYWRSAPQPVRDSIIFFYVKVTTDGITPQLINRFYIDPIYSNCQFNVYWTNGSSNADPGTFTWTPLQRDFTLRKGIYEIPTINCTYLKFEFVQLAVEVYDLPFDSVTRTINVFPYEVEEHFSKLEEEILNGNAVKYSYVGSSNLLTTTQYSSQLSASTLYGIANSTLSDNSWSSLSALNTSQYGNTNTVGITTSSQIIDPTISYKLIDSNGNYNQTSYTQFLQRRFPDTRVHNYTQVTINQSWHEAYFVGIYYLTTFYETVFDDLQGNVGNFTSTGTVASGNEFIELNVNGTVTTPWFSTIDTFNSFNVAGLTTDWRSFLTQGSNINNDSTLLNNLSSNEIAQMTSSNNSAMTLIGSLGVSTIYQINASTSGQPFGIQSPSYFTGTNILSYNDANFASPTAWYSGTGTGTTITGTSVSWSGTNGAGIASGINVSGTNPVACYNFTIPNMYTISGGKPWTAVLGNDTLGLVGYASYAPVVGLSYYFLVNLQSTVSTTVQFYTQFVNPTNNVAYSGTAVYGTSATLSPASGTAVITATGTNYTAGVPSNTIQLVVSGSANTNYNLYQMAASNTPITSWVGPSNRNNMRISGVARMFLPRTNGGSYRASLFGVSTTGATTELAYKTYSSGVLPINTWFDIELSSYTQSNYASFYVLLNQTLPNPVTNQWDIFYISMLAPFYHPIRYEYITQSGSTGWQPITTGVNNPEIFISTVSGLPASGIQLRMTALDPNVYVCNTSVIPQYKQNAYYANLDVNYVGTSKTNEVDSRTSIANKPLFQLNKELHPSAFNINKIAKNIINYSVD